MSILANNDSDDVVLIGKYVHKQKLYILDCMYVCMYVLA